jgi:hypothetical protein
MATFKGLERDAVNAHIDGFLSLVDDTEKTRFLLVEEARSALSVWELLRDWLWMNNLGLDSALKVKVWFALSYDQMGHVFAMQASEILQTLRSQRSQRLSSYPSLTDSGVSEKVAGISCFMIEQHLSAWIDGEIENTNLLQSLKAHLGKCKACTARLKKYRELQSEILKERHKISPISDKVWVEIRSQVRARNRKRIIKISAVVVTIGIVCGILAWVIWTKPEKMPNIYEIQENN